MDAPSLPARYNHGHGAESAGICDCEAARGFRPLFRFTIRELVLLTLVVAVGAAWAVDHARQKAWIAEHYEAAQKVGQIFVLVDGKLILSQPPQEKVNFDP
jgi:hypothetical protein